MFRCSDLSGSSLFACVGVIGHPATFHIDFINISHRINLQPNTSKFHFSGRFVTFCKTDLLCGTSVVKRTVFVFMQNVPRYLLLQSLCYRKNLINSCSYDDCKLSTD